MGRRVFYLLAYSPETGAATVVVGALGVEGPAEDGTWQSHVSWVPMVYEKAEGWQTSVRHACKVGGLTGPIVDHWVETANGITREIAEVEVPQTPTLSLAVEALIDDVLAAGE
jgi:hypothetical protein